MSQTVLVNAVAAKMGGAARHLSGFLSALGTADPERRYLVYLDSNFAPSLPPVQPNIKLIPVRVSKSIVWRLWWDQVFLRRATVHHRASSILSLLNFGPVRPLVPQIVLQRNSTYFSELYAQRVSFRLRADIAARRWLTYKAMEASAAIITPSVAMRDDILSWYDQLPPERFHVIPHAFSCEEFIRSCSERLPSLVASRLSNHQQPNVVRLGYVSHPAPYKGIDILLQGLALLRARTRERFRLYLTVEPRDWPSEVASYERLIASLGLSDIVTFLGRVPQRAVYNVYGSCDVFVFPSWCESFGFPLLEAMAAGLPVIAADTRINREICGDAAQYYSPLSPGAAADSMALVLESLELRRSLGAAAKARAESHHLTWASYAAALVDVVSRISGQ